MALAVRMPSRAGRDNCPGEIGCEGLEARAGEAPLHLRAQRAQAAPVAVDGDDLDVGAGQVAQGEGERAASGAEVGPDAAASTVDSSLDQADVVGVVHRYVASANPTRDGVVLDQVVLDAIDAADDHHLPDVVRFALAAQFSPSRIVVPEQR